MSRVSFVAGLASPCVAWSLQGYIDRERRYAFVNRRHVELLGRSRDSIIARR